MSNRDFMNAAEVMEGPPLKRRKMRPDLPGPMPPVAQRSSQAATRQPKSPREDGGRSVRPRPLHINDKMRVLWQGRDPEWDELDGGSFARWVQSCEDAAQAMAKKEAEPSAKAQVVVVGHGFKALPEDDATLGPRDKGLVALAASEIGGDPIDVPRCRQLSKSRKGSNGGASVSEESDEGQYVRYVSPDGDGAESVEYDMDDEDEEWLAQYNGQASSRGPRALSADTFEVLVDHFEKALHALLQQRVELCPALTDPASEPPDISSMYTLQHACDSEGVAHIHKACIEAVYEHWCKKRLKAKRPLLQRLWFEQPWVQVRDAGKEARPGTQKSSDSDLPFMGQDAPRPPTTRPRRMNAQEALYKLESIRTDLETIRTMADQVRRRERGKKRELLLLREEWRAGHVSDSKEGTSNGSAAALRLLVELPPDREARLASKAAAQAAREAATLLSARVMLHPGSAGDRAAWDAELGPSSAAATRPAEKREALHQPGADHTGECFWCKGEGNLAGCSSCPRCFCFNCYKIRPGYGIVNWGRMLRAPDYNCPVCSGKEPASCEGDSVNSVVRKGLGTPLPLRGAVTLRGRGRGRGRGRVRGRGRGIGQAGRILQATSNHGPSPTADSQPAADEPEAAASEAPALPAAKPAAAARVGKPAAGRKQRPALAAARDGLRHAKQNYEKLAGVKRSRTKAAAARRLIAAARRAPAVKRVVPRRTDQAASKGRKPPLQRRALPGPPAKKVRLEEAAPLADPAKVWKGPAAITLSAVRGRGSSRGGHLRQGTSRHTSAGDRKSAQAADTTRGTVPPKPAATSKQTAMQGAPLAVVGSSQRTGIPGIERSLRLSSQPRRTARVEFVCSCRRHGTFRHDRVPRMVDFFTQHSAPECRPEWAPLAQQPGEMHAACEERLRKIFSFSSAAPLPGPLRSAAAASRALSNAASEPVNASALVSKAKPACKLPAAQRSAVEASKPLLSALERRRMSQSQSKPACSTAAAAAMSTQQQQRRLPVVVSGKATAKQTTRPGLKHAGGCSKCRWKAGGCIRCRPAKSPPSRKRARA